MVIPKVSDVVHIGYCSFYIEVSLPNPKSVGDDTFATQTDIAIRDEIWQILWTFIQEGFCFEL